MAVIAFTQEQPQPKLDAHPLLAPVVPAASAPAAVPEQLSHPKLRARISNLHAQHLLSATLERSSPHPRIRTAHH